MDRASEGRSERKVCLQRLYQARVEEIEDVDLNVNDEAQLLGKGRQGPISVSDGFEEIIDADGGVGRLCVA